MANAATFDNPGWSVVGNLPNSQPGSAAFVQDINTGDCATDTEAGVLFLQSPVISIPSGTSAQMAFDHWVATEAGWDGNNVKVSVNGGSYSVIGSSAYDFNAYNGTLTLSDPQFGTSDNPMAGEAAFTGTDGGSVGGTWGQSQVDLSGIAGGGDDLQLRFELGQDGCSGVIGCVRRRRPDLRLRLRRRGLRRLADGRLQQLRRGLPVLRRRRGVRQRHLRDSRRRELPDVCRGLQWPDRWQTGEPLLLR